MGLSYHFTFTAPADVSAAELERFLKGVEHEARQMGFHPTLVLDAVFNTVEQREFARRIVRSYVLQDQRLKGAVLPAEEQLRDFIPGVGRGRLVPERAVVLVVTDERGLETVFGFARYPATLRDVDGRALLETPLGGRWYFRDFVDSADTRFRQLVKRFADAGYLAAEQDEFATSS